jgi:hypothetical protein
MHVLSLFCRYFSASTANLLKGQWAAPSGMVVPAHSIVEPHNVIEYIEPSFCLEA